jgi:glycine/serine hydroxymethyltransferase
MGPDQMRRIADIMDRAIAAKDDEAGLARLRGEAEALAKEFPLYPDL